MSCVSVWFVEAVAVANNTSQSLEHTMKSQQQKGENKHKSNWKIEYFTSNLTASINCETCIHTIMMPL